MAQYRNDLDKLLHNQKVSKRVSPLRGQKQNAPEQQWTPKMPKALRNALLAIAAAGVIGATVARTNLEMENHAEHMIMVELFDYFYSMQHGGEVPAHQYGTEEGRKAVEREFAEFCRDKELQAHIAQISGIGLQPTAESEVAK